MPVFAANLIELVPGAIGRFIASKGVHQARMGLTHFDGAGAPRMVDVGAKPATVRVAVAAARIAMQPETLAMIRAQLDGRDSPLPKGDVVGVARVAGIMAAKRTPDLIPLCHPLPLSGVDLAIDPAEDPPGLTIEATVRTTARTGVEMEALTAVSVAALTVYDMCKAVDRAMTVRDVRLIRKSGGASGDFQAADQPERED